MDARKWQKIKVILEEVIEISPSLRAAYLEKACAGDEDLRVEIEELLSFEENAVDILEKDVLSSVFEENSTKDLIEKQIGNYKILSELGKGGMGVVYYATRADGEFEQKVALKLIKRGMDSEAVLRRFINERQILASLEHPNIARLIDGGTTSDGIPFFVMEFVEGETITEYAEGKNLDLEERLDLFREVCDAVSFAHQNLVIHRDLKPSNILITKEGKVKLLDFGIAKLLKSETENQTATQMHVFTPEYASPEQVRGEKLTTATDVYSLGVILYELLTETRPYQTESKNISEIIKAVCETEPIRPSSVVGSQWSVVSKTNQNKGQNTNPKSQIPSPRLLKGDLDNIILKALRKEPERRYSSVEQFAEDIRRHQMGLPVTASKDTWNYRAGKFIQRNKISAAAAALILISLLGGLFATLYQRNKAQRRFNDVRQLANSFLFEFHDAIENLPGATPARELVVKRAIEYLDKLVQESEGDPTLQRELGTAYAKIGEIQGNSYHSNLGDTEGAMKSYQKSLEIRRHLYETDPTNREIQHELAASYEGVGDIFNTDNDLPNGLQKYDEALALRLFLVEAEPQNRKYLLALADLYTRRGLIKGTEGYANLGDTLGALEEHLRSVSISEKLVAIEPDEEAQNFLAGALIYLTMQQNAVGKTVDALANGRKAVAMYENLATQSPNNTQTKESLLNALTILRYSLVDENLMLEAEKNARYVLAETEKASAADPKDANVREDLSISYNDLARVLRESGKAQESIPLYERSLQIIEKLASEASNDEFKTNLALTHRFMAEAQLQTGDYKAAFANYERGAATYEKDLAESPENARTKDDLAITYTGMGSALAGMKQNARAAEFFARAIPLAEEAALKSPQNARIQSRLAKTYFESGKNWKQISNDKNSRTKSCELLQKSFDVWDGLRQKGTLSKFNAPRLDEVSRELSVCQ